MSEANPPMAEKRPHQMIEHSHERIDNYYWLRDDNRQDQDVLAYLEAENAFTAQTLSHRAGLKSRLFDEIAGRLVADDQSVPVPLGDYEYYREYRQGGEYPIYVRRKPGDAAPEVLLDVNDMAAGFDYFNVGNWSVSQDETKLAYVTDTVSRRIYNLRIKDLAMGADLEDEIEGVSSSLAWDASGKQLYFVRKDPVTLLPYQVYRHTLGQEQASEELVFEERDQSFYTSVYTTRSKKFVVISSHSNDSSEIRVLDATDPAGEPKVISPREPGHEYRIRHAGEHFFIVTNWQAQNFRLMQVHESEIGNKEAWQEVVAHDSSRLITDFEVFEDYLVIAEQFGGLPVIRVMARETGESHFLEFPDEAYSAWLHTNAKLNTTQLRYGYSSLTTPNSVYEYDMVTRDHQLLKADQVLGGFNRDHYESKRIEITARDGTLVPVSIVYRKDQFEKGESPLYVYGYGSYGSSTDPVFSSKRLSLLDRGIVFAIIHVRGGEELGRGWYEDGKLLNKRNTFWDFIDGTRALVAAGYGAADKVIAMGGSAGGLLMGVIANEAPEDYLGIIAHVPFVDVITTMLDESIPLTTGEFMEWGNPNDREYYDYMLSYSPYDQVAAQDYPHMFITAGLHDSQVQYFEPAKWVAKLREMKTDDNLLLFDVDMTTGHSGASGRFERFQADALEYTFVLEILNSKQ